jgi:hypothetical protein
MTAVRSCTSMPQIIQQLFGQRELFIEAFPEETAPCFLLRDRDQIYREYFRQRVAGMAIEEIIT